MKPDLLTSHLCASDPLKTQEERDALRDGVMGAAYGFLLAGGRVSLTEWAGLDQDSRHALAAAGDVVRREFAELLRHGPPGPSEPPEGAQVPAPAPRGPDPLDAAADKLAAMGVPPA